MLRSRRIPRRADPSIAGTAATATCRPESTTAEPPFQQTERQAPRLSGRIRAVPCRRHREVPRAHLTRMPRRCEERGCGCECGPRMLQRRRCRRIQGRPRRNVRIMQQRGGRAAAAAMKSQQPFLKGSGRQSNAAFPVENNNAICKRLGVVPVHSAVGTETQSSLPDKHRCAGEV